ncbi:MAG: MarR family transcriptional regulator [Peptostreptococcaceae bacterium]
MTKTKEALNGLLVNLFNDILKIEESCLKDIDDLTMTEIHTIEAIGIEEKRAMGEIATNLRITVGTLTSAVNRLLQKGYVIREKDKNDKRVVLISLTEKGEEVFRIHKLFHDQMIENVCDEFDDFDQELLTKLLSKIVLFFENRYDIK